MQTGMIDTAAATAAATASTAKKPSSSIDKNGFLQLLVAQLKNQDPTQSQDPNAMVQQMTSFSTLEQAQNTNTLLGQMETQNGGLFQAQSASLIGRKVLVTGSTLNLKDGGATVGIDLPSAANVALAIQDATGKTVAVLNQGAMSSGNHVIAWDGKDNNGNKLPDGTYTVSVGAVGSDGTAVNASTSSYMTVTAVNFASGAVTVTAGGKQFSLSDITEISA